MQRYKTSGFTLLELMVAIAILAILLGIGIPSFADAMRRNRVANATNSLTGAIALARSEAVKRGVPVTICGSNDQAKCADDDDWSGGMIVFDDDTGTPGKIDGTDQIIQLVTSDSSKVVIEADRAFVTYRANGEVILPAGVMAAVVSIVPKGCQGDDARTMSITRAGRSHVEKIPTCP